MIRLLKIENFQSHKDTIMEFDKGMNVIVGQSDSGKTAIIRALKWLMTNRPLGEEFQSNWGGKTVVSITTTEGHLVSRRQAENGTDKTYIIDTAPLKAFGTEVPDEVLSILNMDETNLQQQMDSPYLLNDTSGAVAAHFNRIAGLEKIDRGLQNIQKEIKAKTSGITYAKQSIETKEAELQRYSTLANFEAYVIRVESMVLQEEKLKTKIKILKGMEVRIEDITKKTKSILGKLRKEAAINYILEKYNRKNVLVEEKEVLNNISIKYFRKQEEIKKAEKSIIAEDSINKILIVYQNRAKSLQESIKIAKLYQNIADNKIMQATKEKQVKILEAQFKSEFPDICPLCNSKIK